MQCGGRWRLHVRKHSSAQRLDNHRLSSRVGLAADQRCVSEERVCRSGALSGSFQFSSCTVAAAGACAFGTSSVADSQSVTAFAAASVPSRGACVREMRVCHDGTLSVQKPLHRRCSPCRRGAVDVLGHAVRDGFVSRLPNQQHQRGGRDPRRDWHHVHLALRQARRRRSTRHLSGRRQLQRHHGLRARGGT